PFKEIIKHISRDEPILSIVLSLYIKIEKLLKSILNKIGLFATINASLVIAIKKGYIKFEKYYDKIKENDIY
ncbi:hypothetical protein BGZ57DRAFT_770300, partial [Hyaloscypha finlandica]